jgi:hypothetical protein
MFGRSRARSTDDEQLLRALDDVIDSAWRHSHGDPAAVEAAVRDMADHRA